MSTQSSAEFVDNVARTLALIREASSLGCEFRVSGADVTITGLDDLPGPLREALQRADEAGWLYTQLADHRTEQAAIEFCKELGVRPMLIETIEDVEPALDTLDEYRRVNGNIVGLDIETTAKPEHRQPGPPIKLTKHGILDERQPKNQDGTGLDPRRANIATMQLFAGGGVCFIFRGPALEELLRSGWLRQQHLVIHNSPFELSFLHVAALDGLGPRSVQPARARIECTMQAGGLVHGVNAYGGGRALDVIAEKTLGQKPPKGLQTGDWGAPRLSQGQLCYAAVDGAQPYLMWPKLTAKMDEDGLWGAYELQRKAAPAVVDMKLRGLGFDRDEHHRMSDVWSAQLNTAQAEYKELTGRYPPENPEQLRDWLRSVLSREQLETWNTTHTEHLLSVAGRDLKRLVGVDSAGPVLEILAKTKLIQNFGPKLASFINPVTGRIHADYLIGGSKSGRFSCRKPNMQQLPSRRYPEFRRVVAAAPGHLLVNADYDQVELRAAAIIWNDPKLQQLFADGRDAHTATAAAIAGVVYDEVTREQRQGAKAINFGLIYGAGPKRVQASIFDDYGIEVSLEHATNVVKTARRTYHRLYDAQHHHYRECQRRGYIVIGAGRIARAEWEKSSKLFFTQCCNLPVQGMCADCMLRAIVLVHQLLRRAGIPGGLVASVHDELLLEVPESYASKALKLLVDAMTQAFEETFPGAPTINLVKAGTGRTWEEAKANA